MDRASRDLFPGALEIMVLRSLQRMLKAGWVKARWGVSPAGRRVRTYELTSRGSRRLRDEMSRFERMLEGIQLVLAEEQA